MFIATTQETRQVSEDSWKVFRKYKKIDRATTVGELVDWYKLIHRHGFVEDLHIEEVEDT